jgi:hypothetical protein
MLNLVLDKALEKCGSSKALAIELEKSPSEITKFRAGESGFKLRDFEKLLQISGLKISAADREEKLLAGLKVMSELFLESGK